MQRNKFSDFSIVMRLDFVEITTYKNMNYAMSQLQFNRIMIIIRLVLRFLAKIEVNVKFFNVFMLPIVAGRG